MSLMACADIVRRGDPDRFLATMAAPAAARAVLFPLYAFNVEVARAPWVTAEPMIAEMRLQWWRDALDEIAAGGMVRRHEVVIPLAQVIDPASARSLDLLVAARRWDIGADPFDTEEAFTAYLADTGGRLMAACAGALGGDGDDKDRAMALGQAAALANFWLAVPALIAAGKRPLRERPEDRVVALSSLHLKSIGGTMDAPLRHASLSAWRARGILRRAMRDPAAVAEGRLQGSEFARRASLLRAQAFGI